ncbi:hypothetical protein Tco_1251496 [Tanacetum coccineum]
MSSITAQQTKLDLELVPKENIFDIGKCNGRIPRTDKTKITRKPSKTGKHGHGKRESTREAKDSKPKPEKVKLQSNGQTSEIDPDPTAQNHDPMIGNLYGQDQKECVMQGSPRIFINWL